MKETVPDIIEDVTMITPSEPWTWLWPVTIILAVVLIGVFAGRRLYRAKKLPFQHPPIPPHTTARQRLASIRRLIDEGLHEQFVIEVSALLRAYIEARFGLKAPTLSTEEFLFEAERSALLDPRWRESLAGFLSECDRVKFALSRMQPPRMEVLYATAETFITDTASEPAANIAQSYAA
jgi:hypothetical protein